MDKESIYELQKIDCNCNDCFFMTRNVEKHKQSVALHHKWQLNYFENKKRRLIEVALDYKDRLLDIKKHDNIMREVAKMKFQFDRKTATIQFGDCTKLNKEVSFIPNQCQLDTQQCFKHRKDGIL